MRTLPEVRPRRRAPCSFSSPFREIFLFSLSLFLPVSLSGCGYALVGTGASAIPATVKTVWVPTFINDTTVVAAEQKLTDAVLRELSARGRLKPVPDRAQADAELNGRLTSLSLTPVRFDDAGLAVEYQLTITANLSLAEKSTEKILFKEPSFVFRQPYNVLGSSKSYYDREREAIEALARPFAQSLVTTILEGF
ncbi:MAG TPA: LptE family protein [Thermoanaerobaculia bacterium]|nr:LptE family protein [Thermoanaerobaculia bacterium]